MDDLTRTILDIAYGPIARSKLEVAEHYRSMLLEAQRDYDPQELLRSDPGYIEWANRIDSQEGK